MGELSNNLSGKFVQSLACFTLLLFVFSFLLIPLSLAHEQGFTSAMVERGQKLDGKELPGFAAAIFGNEIINFYISADDGDIEFITVVTEDKKIKSVKAGLSEGATLNLYISEATIKKIDGSENVVGAAQKALESKEITYEAIGLFNKIKFGFLSFIFNIFGGSSDIPSETIIVINDTSKTVDANKTAVTIVQEPEIVPTQPPVQPSAQGGFFADINNPTEAELNYALTNGQCVRAGRGFDANSDITVKTGDCIDLRSNKHLILIIKDSNVYAYYLYQGRYVEKFSFNQVGTIQRNYSLNLDLGDVQPIRYVGQTFDPYKKVLELKVLSFDDVARTAKINVIFRINSEQKPDSSLKTFCQMGKYPLDNSITEGQEYVKDLKGQQQFYRSCAGANYPGKQICKNGHVVWEYKSYDTICTADQKCGYGPKKLTYTPVTTCSYGCSATGNTAKCNPGPSNS